MYRMVYLTLSNSEAELPKFLREISPAELNSKPIRFGLKFVSQFKSANFFRILSYMVGANRAKVQVRGRLLPDQDVPAEDPLAHAPRHLQEVGLTSFGKFVSPAHLSKYLVFGSQHLFLEFMAQLGCDLEVRPSSGKQVYSTQTILRKLDEQVDA